MRVCMVAYSFYESDNRVMRYAETLAARGDQVEVLSLRQPGQATRETISGVQVSRIQERTRNEKGKFSYLFRILSFLVRAMMVLSVRHLQKPYEVVHVHSVPDFLVFTAIVPKLTGAKVILDIHDILPEFYASKFNRSHDSWIFKSMLVVERVSATFADHVIIANDLWREKLTARRTVPPEKCTTILNTPDLAVFHRRGRVRMDGKFIIIYPGSLNWHQGLDIAIRALAEIKDDVPNVELHIYGEGNAKPQLEQLTEELGLTGRVCFKGVMTLREIAVAIENADLGVVPKRADGFGNEAFSTKILEYMCLGVPVVVSATKIDRFYFDDSIVEFFESGNERELASAMLRLAGSRSARAELAQRASLFAEKMTWDTHQYRYLRIVSNLAGKENPVLA